MRMASDFQPFGRSLYQMFPPIRYMATTFWISWVLLIYSGEFFAGGSHIHWYDTLSYMVSTAAISLTFLLFGVSKERGFQAVQNKKVIYAAAVVASVGTVLVLAAPLFNELASVVAVLGSAMTGIGTGCLAMRLATQFSEEAPKNAFILTAATLAAALVLYSAVLTFPLFVGVGIIVLLPVIAAFFSFIDYGSDLSARIEGDTSLPLSFIRFIAAIFILALVLSVTRGFYPNGLRVDEFNLSRGFVAVALIACCVVVAVIAAIAPKGFAFGNLGYWVILVVVFAFTIVPIAGLGSLVTGVTFSVANGLLGMIAWALFASLSSRSGISPLRIYGLGFSAFMFGSTLGWPIGYAVDTLHLTELLGYFSAAMLVVVFLVCFVLFPNSNLSTISNSLGSEEEASEQGSADNSQEIDDGSARPRWRVRMMGLAEEYELSAREAEVFMLMAKGKNSRAIADELCVSYNTARTHVRNIYTKTGVHSRLEFDQLVEGRPLEL